MIPWAYFVPGRGYVQRIKIARACPEITHLMHAVAREDAKSIASLVLWVPIMGPIAIVAGVTAWAWEYVERALSRLGPYRSNAAKVRLVQEAHQIVPIEEIRRRIGLETPKIIGLSPRPLTTPPST